MLINLAFLYILLILGWIYGHSWHSNIEPGDSIILPAFLIWIFGRPNIDGLYNIRGIYFQCLIFAITGYFTLYNLNLISQQDAGRALFLTMLLVIGFSELIRFFTRR